MKPYGKRAAFTLAEVLITLVVIGVVAAITVPVLISNTNGKEYNAAKQKARASLGEAFKLAGLNQDLDESLSAKEYVEQVLSRNYLKISKICNTASECGFADKIKTPEGNDVNTSTALANWLSVLGSTAYGKLYSSNGVEKVDVAGIYGSKAPAYFQTLDGFSVAMFYNPSCRAGELDNPWSAGRNPTGGIVHDTSFGAVCFSAVYDMNGKKGPNRVGYDVGFVGSFYSGIYARSAAVLPVPDGYTASTKKWAEASEICKKAGGGNQFDLPTIDELSLIYLNNSLAGNASVSHWSRSNWGASSFRHVSFTSSYMSMRSSGGASGFAAVRCVRNDNLM